MECLFRRNACPQQAGLRQNVSNVLIALNACKKAKAEAEAKEELGSGYRVQCTEL